jgi:hypothetical protein
VHRKKSQLGFTSNIAVLFIGVLVLGFSGVLFASDLARPRGFLYPVDTSIEDFRIEQASSLESKVALHTKYSAERVAEIQQILQGKDVDYQALDIAITNLIVHKKAIVQLVLQEDELKNESGDIDDSFEQLEEKLRAIFDTATSELDFERTQLKIQLTKASDNGDVSKEGSIVAQIAKIETQIDILKGQKRFAENSLAAEEEKLESRMNEEAKALEKQENALKWEEERIKAEREKLMKSAE